MSRGEESSRGRISPQRKRERLDGIAQYLSKEKTAPEGG